jgi:hypothetical protein
MENTRSKKSYPKTAISHSGQNKSSNSGLLIGGVALAAILASFLSSEEEDPAVKDEDKSSEWERINDLIYQTYILKGYEVLENDDEYPKCMITQKLTTLVIPATPSSAPRMFVKVSPNSFITYPLYVINNQIHIDYRQNTHIAITQSPVSSYVFLDIVYPDLESCLAYLPGAPPQDIYSFESVANSSLWDLLKIHPDDTAKSIYGETILDFIGLGRMDRRLLLRSRQYIGNYPCKEP